jgi:hypothetical protein
MKTFFAVMLLSCVAFAQDEAAIAKAKAACGPEDVSFSVKTSEGSHPPATVEPGKALVYVVGQDPACSSCGKVARIGLDGSWAGAIDFALIRPSPLNRASIIYAPTGNRSLPVPRSPQDWQISQLKLEKFITSGSGFSHSIRSLSILIRSIPIKANIWSPLQK